jgi:type III secretion protein R
MIGFDNMTPLSLILLLVAVGLAPYLALLVTSYTKIVVVLSLIRNAVGVQSIPPNTVINGMAIILTLFIMNPLMRQSIATIEDSDFFNLPYAEQKQVMFDAVEPFRAFLIKHSDESERKFFLMAAKKLWPPELAKELQEDDILIIIPAFTVTELRTAFQIGFLLYLPFVAIDIVISNILMAMGMVMLSPTTISLPFKLLLFVMVDGWGRLVHGLILTYT